MGFKNIAVGVENLQPLHFQPLRCMVIGDQNQKHACIGVGVENFQPLRSMVPWFHGCIVA
jgi:hypothetical protein